MNPPKVFFIYFIYSLVVASITQLVLVPRLLDESFQVEGLVVPDSIGFHEMAVELSNKIKDHGWSEWNMRYNGQSPASIAAVFYCILTPSPWVLLPYNAFIHALSGLVVYLILNSIFKSKKASFVGAAVFVVNPTSLEWVSQIHRDGLFILGNVILLYSSILLVKFLQVKKYRLVLYASVFIIFSGVIFYLTRAYWNQVALFISGVLLFFIAVYLLINNPKGLMCQEGLVFILFGILILIHFHVYGGHNPVQHIDKIQTKEIDEQDLEQNVEPFDWSYTVWVPDFLERKLHGLSYRREGAKLPSAQGRSDIDHHVKFDSVSSMVFYFPRALQVGLLAPFPSDWSASSIKNYTGVAKSILGVITVISYLLLFAYACFYVANCKNLFLNLSLIFSLIGLLAFTYVYPNVGTLIRFRYCFYSLMLAIGGGAIAYVIHLCGERKKSY